MWRPRRLIGWIVVTAILAALGFAYHVVSLVMTAEVNLFWTRTVMALAAEYVAEYGEWPRSWQDLGRVKRAEDWHRAEDWREAQGSVFVDFGADLDELAGQSAEQFRAIREIRADATFIDDEYHAILVEPLLKAIRQRAAEDAP